MSNSAIEVPMQPYAGKLLIIENLIVPDSEDLKPGKPLAGKKPPLAPIYADSPRPTFFEPRVIERTLLKHCTTEGLTKELNAVLVEALLSAVETYMKHFVKSVIDLCEHRSGNNLYNDPRCVLEHNMRTTMMFLNDREVADYGCSDDDSAYGHRRRWMKLQRNRNANSVESEMRLESTNTTALMALGVRKPLESVASGATGLAETGAGAGAGAGQPPQRTFITRIKHMNVKDIVQLMEDDKRYKKSKLLYDAYLTYKW